MSKKIIAIIVAAVALMIALVLLVWAIGLGVFLGNNNPPDDSGNPGSSDAPVLTDDGYARIPVKVTKNPGMIAAQLSLKFDADVFEFVECENGNLFADCQTNRIENEINCLLTADFSKNSDVTQTGTMFTVVLKVKEGAKSGKYSLEINSSKTSYANISEQFVNPKIEIGSIKIK